MTAPEAGKAASMLANWRERRRSVGESVGKSVGVGVTQRRRQHIAAYIRRYGDVWREGRETLAASNSMAR